MIDTDGIYDRCQCGERADIEYSETDVLTRAVCHSCGAATQWHLRSSSVMVEWNRYQRNIGLAKKVAAGKNNKRKETE